MELRAGVGHLADHAQTLTSQNPMLQQDHCPPNSHLPPTGRDPRAILPTQDSMQPSIQKQKCFPFSTTCTQQILSDKWGETCTSRPVFTATGCLRFIKRFSSFSEVKPTSAQWPRAWALGLKAAMCTAARQGPGLCSCSRSLTLAHPRCGAGG